MEFIWVYMDFYGFIRDLYGFIMVKSENYTVMALPSNSGEYFMGNPDGKPPYLGGSLPHR